MAKSIRSKKMRKLRAFKRIRYGEKELARLKNMLDKAAEEEKQNAQNAASAPQIEVAEPTIAETTAPVMEVDSGNVKAEVTKPSKYPCWLSNFKIKKLAKVERKCKRKEAKRLKKQQKEASKSGKKKSKGKK